MIELVIGLIIGYVLQHAIGISTEARIAAAAGIAVMYFLFARHR